MEERIITLDDVVKEIMGMPGGYTPQGAVKAAKAYLETMVFAGLYKETVGGYIIARNV